MGMVGLMDQYIKMCREATEIQKLWAKSIGDHVYYPESEMLDCYTINGRHYKDDKDELEISGWWDWVHQDKLTWIPRIEDLIELVKTESDTGVNIEARFSFWVFDGKMRRPVGPTYQVLWLCFIMYTLYNKSWDGKTWN